MSDPLVSGFTTAAGIYGGSGQLKHIFGIKIPRAYGLFQIVKVRCMSEYEKIKQLIKHGVLFMECRQRVKPQNAASHLGLFCLLRGISSKNEIKMYP